MARALKAVAKNSPRRESSWSAGDGVEGRSPAAVSEEKSSAAT